MDTNNNKNTTETPEAKLPQLSLPQLSLIGIGESGIWSLNYFLFTRFRNIQLLAIDTPEDDLHFGRADLCMRMDEDFNAYLNSDFSAVQTAMKKHEAHMRRIPPITDSIFLIYDNSCIKNLCIAPLVLKVAKAENITVFTFVLNCENAPTKGQISEKLIHDTTAYVKEMSTFYINMTNVKDGEREINSDAINATLHTFTECMHGITSGQSELCAGISERLFLSKDIDTYQKRVEVKISNAENIGDFIENALLAHEETPLRERVYKPKTASEIFLGTGYAEGENNLKEALESALVHECFKGAYGENRDYLVIFIAKESVSLRDIRSAAITFRDTIGAKTEGVELSDIEWGLLFDERDCYDHVTKAMVMSLPK